MTKSYQYELHKASAEDWRRYEIFMTDINWEKAAGDLDTQKKVDKFLELLEKRVDTVFKKKEKNILMRKKFLKLILRIKFQRK